MIYKPTPFRGWVIDANILDRDAGTIKRHSRFELLEVPSCLLYLGENVFFHYLDPGGKSSKYSTTHLLDGPRIILRSISSLVLNPIWHRTSHSRS